MARGQNPETLLTNFVRAAIDRAGGYQHKVSDSFTRGIPDLTVVGDRVVLVEFKVGDHGVPDAMGWRQLGLSGAQDHVIRQVCRRAPRGACVVTGTPLGKTIRGWVPLNPEAEILEGRYALAASTMEGLLSWLGLTRV